jgi:hypothetical protein
MPTCDLVITHYVINVRVVLKISECNEEEVEGVRLLEEQLIDIKARHNTGQVLESNDNAICLCLIECVHGDAKKEQT